MSCRLLLGTASATWNLPLEPGTLSRASRDRCLGTFCTPDSGGVLGPARSLSLVRCKYSLLLP